MDRIAVFFAEGFEEIEALTVVDLCRRAGITTDMVSVTGSQAVTGSHGITITADRLLEEVDFDTLTMLVLPGGMPGTKNLEACAPLMEHLDRFHAAEKYISAICAAPGIFGRRGYLQGRPACSYPTVEGELAGASVTHEPVTLAGHITTSRGLGTAIPFALAIIERLLGKEKSEEIAKSIVFTQA